MTDAGTFTKEMEFYQSTAEDHCIQYTWSCCKTSCKQFIKSSSKSIIRHSRRGRGTRQYRRQKRFKALTRTSTSRGKVLWFARFGSSHRQLHQTSLLHPVAPSQESIMLRKTRTGPFKGYIQVFDSFCIKPEDVPALAAPSARSVQHPPDPRGKTPTAAPAPDSCLLSQWK